MTTGRLKMPMWLVPLAIAGLVAVFGWWGENQLRGTVEEQLRAQLKATLNANVTALEIWMKDQTRLAEELASELRMRNLSTAILDKVGQTGDGGRPLLEQTELDQFGNFLRPRLAGTGYQVAEIINTNFAVVAGSVRRIPPGMQVSEAHTNKFAELFANGEAVIITPYKPEFQPPPRGGPRGGARGGRRGGTNDLSRGRGGFPPGRRGDVTLMQVAAPIKDTSGTIRGALALVINPDEEFSKILSVAQRGKTGETYAFDQTGLLISRSRFEAELKAKGLLDTTNATSALNLRLHDPKGETVEGSKPLMKMVAEAVAGEDGLDVEPSRDYRGEEVVGAWRWLPEQGFGVVTQIDATEAYRPLRVLKLLFIMLCLLLLLCATGMFVFSYANFTSRRRLSEAELKLKQLGQYTLEEKIGEGGMGIVYRARHALMRRDTAVKLLLPDRADALSIERFEREVVLTSQLTHPNTIQIYDYGHTPEGVFYYAMEFLRGLNLHELIARYGPQPEGRVVHILAQICDSLSEAHALGLVHRDVKPANVFLCNRGGVPDCVKVLDFGLVREFSGGKLDELRTVVGDGLEGTPWFMPPESIKDSRHSDPRSDIYSLGALGYYLLTGEFVFEGETVAELIHKHLGEIPLPPSQRSSNPVSPEMDAALMQCLEKDAGKRPQSAMELRALLVATPRAAEWNLDTRATWWAKYQSETGPKPGETEHPKSQAMDVKVSVDIESRL